MQLLTADNVVKRYSNHLALDGVSMEVREGTIFGLLGPNGAGKTSLIRIMNQITEPDSGHIFLNGERLKPADVMQFGYLPEERGLYKKMKVGEQALYLARLKGVPRKEALRRLKFWFEKFEIQTWWDKKVEELSKGMQQKIQFIVTVLHEPKMLIFDEPFSGFDPVNANILKQEILRMKNEGSTIILSTHNMNSVEELCDDIALIHKAKTMLSGKMSDIRNNYKSNIYEVEFSGFVNMIQAALRHQYEILSHDERDGLHIVRFRLLDTTVTTNQLIGALMQVGNIIGFREVLPTMNDIFIKVVGHTDDMAVANGITE